MSKWPLGMKENHTYGDVEDDDEQKGFIVAKITRSGTGGSRDYYIMATHTNASSDPRGDQIEEMEDYLLGATPTLAEIPNGSRVIVTGDLNTSGQSGGLDGLGVPVTGYPNQTDTEYYAHSRDSTLNFYHNNGDRETIDFVQPVICAGDFTSPTSFQWHVHPVRDTGFKFAELSDHFAVSGVLTYAPTAVPPKVCDVTITANHPTYTGSYTYTAANGATSSSANTFQWYRASTQEAVDKEAISGATSTSYTAVTSDDGLYVTFCVTPSDGTTPGIETCSKFTEI